MKTEAKKVVLVLVRPGVKVQYIESDLLPETQTAYIISPEALDLKSSPIYEPIGQFYGIPVYSAEPYQIKKISMDKPSDFSLTSMMA